MTRFSRAAFVLVVSILTAEGKRLAPEEPKPVRFENVTYSVPNFTFNDDSTQNGGFLEARDVKQNLLWRIQVFTTYYNPHLEHDGQDVFITSLSLDEARRVLLLSDEQRRVFAVDISTRKVTRLR